MISHGCGVSCCGVALVYCFVFWLYFAHRDLHVLTHAFPARRSSDLGWARRRRCSARCPACRQNAATAGGVSVICWWLCWSHSGHGGWASVGSTAGPVPPPPTLPRMLWHPSVSRCQHVRSCPRPRSEEHTSELQSLMRISYAVFCLKKKKR